MKKLLCIMLSLLFLFSTVAHCESARTDDAVIFDAAIGMLRQMDSRESVEEAQTMFSGITSKYKQSNLFAIYAAAILNIYDGNYDEALTRIEVLGMNRDFVKLLKEYRLQTGDILALYIEARKLEDSGDYQGALEKYAQMNFYDSADRMVELLSKSKEQKYIQAQTLFEAGYYAEAAEAFLALGNYKDSAEMAKKAVELVPTPTPTPTLTPKPTPTLTIEEAKAYQIKSIQVGGYYTAGLRSDGTVLTTSDSDAKSVSGWEKIVEITTGQEILGLKSDGTVECLTDDLSEWNNIISISAGVNHYVGLKSDGSVVAGGRNAWGECDVNGWKDIIMVECGKYHTVGLKSDGTVMATGENRDGQCNVSGWRDIVAVYCSYSLTVGLKSNGTVVATKRESDFDVSNWKNIVAIDVSDYHGIIGLKSDGTVLYAGYDWDGESKVGIWRDIIAVSCGDGHSVGLKHDGTVVAIGNNGDGQCNVDNWRDIIAITCGDRLTVGLKRDGTVVATGSNHVGQCDVSGWRNIRTY